MDRSVSVLNAYVYVLVHLCMSMEVFAYVCVRVYFSACSYECVRKNSHARMDLLGDEWMDEFLFLCVQAYLRVCVRTRV